MGWSSVWATRGQGSSVHPVHDEHARAGHDHLRHDHLLVVGVSGREALLHPAFVHVVELLEQSHAHLGHEGRQRDAWSQPRHGRRGDRQRADVGGERLCHARVLDLDRHLTAVWCARPMYLAQGRRGDSLGVETGQHVAPSRTELVDEHRLDLVERQRRYVLLQPGEGFSPGPLGVLREEHLHRREKLAGLERPTLHVTQGPPCPCGGALAQLAADDLGVVPHRSAHSASGAVSQSPRREAQQAKTPTRSRPLRHLATNLDDPLG